LTVNTSVLTVVFRFAFAAESNARSSSLLGLSGCGCGSEEQQYGDKEEEWRVRVVAKYLSAN